MVCSADKLLGSVQAGLIVGRESHVEQARRNPLYRTLRLDKLRLTLLHHTLTRYLTGQQDSVSGTADGNGAISRRVARS